MTPKPLILAMTGASGAIYGIRLLEVLMERSVEVHLVLSPWAEKTWFGDRIPGGGREEIGCEVLRGGEPMRSHLQRVISRWGGC